MYGFTSEDLGSHRTWIISCQLNTSFGAVVKFFMQMMALFGRKLQYIFLSSVNYMKVVWINQTSLREFVVYWRTHPMILHVISAHLTSAWRSQMLPSCTVFWFLEHWYILFMFLLHISDATSKKNMNIWSLNPQTTDFCGHLQYQFLASQSEGKRSFMTVLCTVVILKVLLPCGLRLLTLHFDWSRGTRFFGC